MNKHKKIDNAINLSKSENNAMVRF